MVTRRYLIAEAGPFTTEAAYNDFLVSEIYGNAKTRSIVRSQMRDDHEIVFSHNDLHGINIIARPGVGIAAIFDWKLAGFYPECIDLVKPLRVPDFSCGYHEELFNIFPCSYEAEFIVHQAITHWSKY